MIPLEKLKILTPLQKLPKNVGDVGKLIAAKGFEKFLKIRQNIKFQHLSKIWKNTYIQMSTNAIGIIL